MKIDCIYTPPTLAHELVDSVELPIDTEDIIADFAAGSGELLIAAHNKWPSAKIVATDINSAETHSLKKKYRNWQIGKCDFLNPVSRNNSPIIRHLIKKTRFVILNPPFSCRGGKRILASASGNFIKCSLGLAFVINSIDYLVPEGKLVAILPSGSLNSERDADAWKLLRKIGQVETIKHNGHQAFPKGTVDTAIIRFINIPLVEQQDSLMENESRISINIDTKYDFRIVRGNIQMNEVEISSDDDSIKLIHSTDLKEGEVICSRKVKNKTLRLVKGPMILLSRVGRPRKEKVVCYTDDGLFALSDCIFALLCPTIQLAKEVYKAIINNWNQLESNYSGSGAKYITIKKYICYLAKLGYQVRNTDINTKNEKALTTV